MSAVVLDSTPLGLLSHPRNPPHVAACRQWLGTLVAAGRRVIVPEIADYEVRRELIRRNSQRALANLDQLCTQLEYLPITTRGMRLAANLWAQARNAGLPTAAGHALDGDVVLAAQANSLNVPVYRRDGQSGTLVAISSCGFVVECQGVRTAIANSTPCQTSLLSASSPGWCAGRLLAYPVFVA